MAVENPIGTFTAQAGASLSNRQYRFVKFTGAGLIDVCNAATNIACGVLQNNPDNGEAAVVAYAGYTKIEGNAALTAGQLVGTSADGQADPKTEGTDSTEWVHGIVWKGCTSAASLGTIILGGVPFRAA